MAPLIPNGRYMICNRSSYLTLADGRAIWLPLEGSANQKWIVENVSTNHVTLKNVQTEMYLSGPEEVVYVMQPLVGSDRPMELTVNQAEGPTFKLVKMCEGEKGSLGIHILRIWPPMATLLSERIPSEGLEFQPA